MITNEPSTGRDQVIAQYSTIEAAMEKQRDYDSRSLISEAYAHRGQWGLHFAATHADVKSHLANGAPINGVKAIDYGDGIEHWETPLLTAIIDERLEVALSLIDLGAEVDAPNLVRFPNGTVFGHTALHMLAARGESDGLKLLISVGADVNRQTSLGTTPLRFATDNDDQAMAKLLLDSGADPRICEF